MVALTLGSPVANAQPLEGAAGLAPAGLGSRASARREPAQPTASRSAAAQPAAAQPAAARRPALEDARLGGDEDDDEAPFHLGLDVAWARTRLHFVTGQDVVGRCIEEPCSLPSLDLRTLRASASIGWRGMALEASLLSAISSDVDHMVWSLGVRFDTSYDALLSFAFRLAYVGRMGEVEGRGGRAGLALQLRPFRAFVLYGEASLDITGVPETFSALGAVFSYSSMLSLGARFVFSG